MTAPLREPHYEIPEGLRPRNEVDPGISDDNVTRKHLYLDVVEGLFRGTVDPRLVSSAFGTLDRILLTLPASAVGALRPAYLHLLASLPGATRLVVLCSSVDRPAVDRLLQDAAVLNRTDIAETDYPIDFSIWAQDAYAVVQEGGTGASILVEPANFTRYDDGFIADIVSVQTDVEAHSVPLYFQGGNILIGDDYWLIGADYPTKAIRLGLIQPGAGESGHDAAVRRYGEELERGRRMLIVGTKNTVPETAKRPITINGETWHEILYYGAGEQQPLFHIDMFITLAGRDAAGKPVALVGDPKIAANILGEPISPLMLIPYYDEVAAQLEREGFTVIRNPLPLTYVDMVREKRRYWYFATANNALVEITSGTRRVWLPSYGHGSQQHLQATDTANRQIWERLGFTVTMLSDFNPFASNLGAVHCITKYLNRG